MMTPQQVAELIKKHIPNAKVEVEDPTGDGAHLACTVIAKAFEGKPLLARHRMVYAALGDAFDGPIHALQMKTLTPEQAQNA